MVVQGIPRICRSRKDIMSEENRTKIAWCLIIKPDDREAELLDRLLGCEKLPKERKINYKGVSGLAQHVDKLFVTITGKNEKCEEVARKYGAEISYYEWDKNFAKARNFNFSQVPAEYDYIGWCDADDIIKNAHMIKDIVKTSKDNAVDAIVMRYLYDFDMEGQCIVEHLKTRIVRNDGTAIWAGSVHEDFAPERQWLAIESKDIQIFHLTDLARVEIGKKRNTEIASIGLAENRNDPRSYWNLANAYITEGKEQDALPVFLEFLERSQSEEERFLAWHRIAGIFKNLGDYERAITTELEALSLRPWYPEAYFALGEMYLKIGKLGHAREMIEMGFTKNPPEKSIIVWNPRDYDYNPRMTLGLVYLQLKKPKEAVSNFKKCLKVYPRSKNIKKLLASLEPELKQFEYADNLYKKALKIKDKVELKKLLDEVPSEMKHYPAIVNLRNNHFVKETSSGKDVVIFCGYTTQTWNPEIASTRGVGGSEEAVIQLAKRWQASGYNVTVYANIGHEEKAFDGVSYVPFMSWNYRDKQDVTILWRHPKQLDYNINSDVVLVDMHDVIPKKEFTADRITRVTKVMFKSSAHRDYYSQIPDSKIVVIPHGLDITQFDKRRNEIIKDPYKIINT
ncbi:MAG: tetratricopeptide repeat protein, partial [Patescibacteria group bacterium]